MRERGLKWMAINIMLLVFLRRSREGAWIEIMSHEQSIVKNQSLP